MENKGKPCKGINKCKTVKGCGKISLYRTYGLCPSCLFEWSQNNENGKVWYQKKFMPKVKLKTRQYQKKIEKQDKEKLVNWRSKLQTKIQEISRLIDIGLPCLARGYHAGQIHGGHIFSKGSNKTIALNLHNIHRQSAQSNKWQNDDGLLREGLRNEYGSEYYNFISELRRCDPLHYINLEYKEFYKKACKIALKLKREGKTFDLKERIKKRNEINKELGIYSDEFCYYL